MLKKKINLSTDRESFLTLAINILSEFLKEKLNDTETRVLREYIKLGYTDLLCKESKEEVVNNLDISQNSLNTYNSRLKKKNAIVRKDGMWKVNKILNIPVSNERLNINITLDCEKTVQDIA